MSSGSLKEFYTGKTVFLTGGTGYVGKAILSKLMRWGSVKEVLLLSRPKKGKTNDERLDEILNGFLFEEISRVNSNFKNKLRIINGELEANELGLSVDDKIYIQNNVDIIIHGAATVKFDEPIRKAIGINVFGSKSLLDIALKVKDLKSFVYISTAYSQCPRTEINETFYETPMDFREAINLMKEFSDEILDPLTRKLILPWPNTYTFTKAVSEDMMRQYLDKLPVIIIRPSVVISTLRDPVPGYSDCLLGILGMGIGFMTGVLRVVRIKPQCLINCLGVDVVVNSVLALPWYQLHNPNINQIPVFNCTYDNPKMTLQWIVEKAFVLSRVYPSKLMVWKPMLILTSSEFLYRIYFFIYHCIPAYLIDALLNLKGSKMRLMKIYKKMYPQLTLVSYFMSRTWKMNNSNIVKLHDIMDESESFSFDRTIDDDASTFDWAIYGLRKYFLKESEDDLKFALKKLKILDLAYYILLFILYGCSIYIMYTFLGSTLTNAKNQLLRFFVSS